MTTATPTPNPSPLSAEQHQQLLEANRQARKIYAAAKVASFNGWSIGIIAGLSVPFALGSWPAMTLLLGLAVVVYNEFRGRKQLRLFDAATARMLGWNQVGLMFLLFGYCGWSWYLAHYTKADLPAELQQLRSAPEFASTFGSVEGLYRLITTLLYGGVAAATLVFQGLNALYYFTRASIIRAYVAQTPAWVLELQRTNIAA
ncbi:MAG: hypothetical protein JSS27_13865 [Planctomycetes bacterium]|nr:hypothetical protein [Planctomycetota bacterium]